jgi:hypothetical protein
MNYDAAEGVRRAAATASAEIAQASGDPLEPFGISQAAQTMFVRSQMLQLAALAPAASLGTCRQHGRQLQFEGRSDGLWVSCGVPPCEWKVA